MEDVFGAAFTALVGAFIAAGSYAPWRASWNRVQSARSWVRADAHVTRAWHVKNPTAEGGMAHYAEYTFVALETGTSYNGKSANATETMATGDQTEVMYDPKAPENNKLPTGYATLWFYVFAYGTLVVFGVALALLALTAAAVMLFDLNVPGL